MKSLLLTLAATVAMIWLAGASEVRAGGTLDQSNVVSTFTFDAAPASSVSRAQTFTVGLSGLLSQVNLEIYKSTGTLVNPTVEILGTTNSTPDDAKLLFSTVVPLSIVPTFDSPRPGAFAMTSVDVSSAGIMVTPGEVLAIGLVSDSSGAPPMALMALWNRRLQRRGSV
jgi:hypothetical protein